MNFGLRLVLCSSPKVMTDTFAHDYSIRPSILMSYYFLRYEPILRACRPREWVLDSGAFSSFNHGKPIALEDYIAGCRRLIEEYEDLTEVFALDVIGDWRATVKNTEAMWKAGIEAIPCFHAGEPEEMLKSIAADYPKIALGAIAGSSRRKARYEWVEQVFARIWPKPVHGFGVGQPDLLKLVPWETVDVSTYITSTHFYGRWPCFDNASLRIYGNANLKPVVQWYLDLEKDVDDYWQRELAKLPARRPLREGLKGILSQI